MDQNETENLRILACDIIQNAGVQLKLPQVAISTAQMLLHRVYHIPDYTFERYQLDITSMAALFLASKIEEYPRRAREVIDVFTYVVSHELKCKISLTCQEQAKLMEELFTAEKRLLKTLGFNLLSSYPHKIIIAYYNAMVCKLDPEQNVWKERDRQRLLQRAWNYCNDSLRLDIYLKFRKEAVAFACIQMACEDMQMLFPKTSDDREWYLLFLPDEDEVLRSIEMLRDLYLRKRVLASDYRRYIFLNRYQKLNISAVHKNHR